MRTLTFREGKEPSQGCTAGKWHGQKWIPGSPALELTFSVTTEPGPLFRFLGHLIWLTNLLKIIDCSQNFSLHLSDPRAGSKFIFLWEKTNMYSGVWFIHLFPFPPTCIEDSGHCRLWTVGWGYEDDWGGETVRRTCYSLYNR